jgi:hypothetical protein
MELLRLSPWLLVLSLFVAWPSLGHAQQTSPTLQIAQLSCPACACEKARHDLALLRPQYREIHGKVSTLAPQLVVLAGFSAAAVATYFSVYVLGVSPKNSSPDMRTQRRLHAMVGLAIAIPLGVGLGGASWLAVRQQDGAPYREREKKLAIEFKETQRFARAQCRNARS